VNPLLITFLGRVPRVEQGYRTTRYDFGDGTPEEETAFFGWALCKRLRPRRLVIYGTAGSMWDHLFEKDIDLGESGEQDRLALMDAVENQTVTQDQLDHLAPLLETSLGIPVQLRIIPYCRTESEQVELLQIMADKVEEKEQVHIDITHGFRHLPMLALLAALYIQQLKQAEVFGIWYGSFDPDTKKAPVYDLSGLLRIADWLQAFASFDKDGDYRAFTPLLRDSGLDENTCGLLDRAAYFENILNVGEATGQLRKTLQGLDAAQASLAPDAQLLMPALRERLDWISESKQFEKQLELARTARARGDYLRAVLYGYEAVITRVCQLGNKEINSFDDREDIRKRYENCLREERSKERDNYFLLKNIRNQVAHGSRGSVADVQKTMLDEGKMGEFLDEVLIAVDQESLPEARTVLRAK